MSERESGNRPAQVAAPHLDDVEFHEALVRLFVSRVQPDEIPQPLLCCDGIAAFRQNRRLEVGSGTRLFGEREGNALPVSHRSTEIAEFPARLASTVQRLRMSWLLEGILDYVNRHNAWSVALPEQKRGASPAEWLARWNGDGIIARIETAELANAGRQTGLPAIDVSAARQLPGIPTVDTDDQAVARLAADHLLQRGFPRLAYWGDPGFNWSRRREQYFAESARNAGCELFIHQSLPATQQDYSWIRERFRLAEWVSQIPLPIGVMVSDDVKALQLLDVCRELDIAVPEEIAVVGVEHDHLLCDLAIPSLTSIIPDTHRSGYEAAKILDRLMSGKQPSSEVHGIKPLGIQTRIPTDTLAISNPDIARAMRFIRENATTGIDVSDILEKVPLSRAVLESQFRRTVHSWPHQEIMRVRIERVKELLSATPLTLAEIAARTGFNRVEYLSVVFRRKTGQAPGEFHRRHATVFRQNSTSIR